MLFVYELNGRFARRSIDNLLKRASDTLAEPANAHPARPEGLRPLSAQAGGQVGH
jgi:hypothetical protein